MGTSHTIYPGIEGWMFDADLLYLRKRARGCKEILEVGSFCGLSTAVLSEEGRRVTCVDTFMGGEDLPVRDSYPTFERNMKALGRWELLTVKRMTSDRFFDNSKYRGFDFIFVDGSHAYESVRKDIFYSVQQLRTEGVLVVDDIDWGDTKPVMAALSRLGYAWRFVKGTKMAEVLI